MKGGNPFNDLEDTDSGAAARNDCQRGPPMLRPSFSGRKGSSLSGGAFSLGPVAAWRASEERCPAADIALM
jgi:hypothetical protein